MNLTGSTRTGFLVALDRHDFDLPEHERKNPWRVQFQIGESKWFLNFPTRKMARAALKSWREGMSLDDIANTLKAYRALQEG